MDITIFPGKLTGSISAIPSKSQAHRLLICAAFADTKTELLCPQTSQDIDATASCLSALGAIVRKTDSGYVITPTTQFPETALLDCGESGSTLRFLLPIVGALGVDATFKLSGRLPNRPLSPLWEEMERMGCLLSRPTGDTIRCTGKLRPGNYQIDGSVSSQFISGLLFAMALMPGSSKLTVTGKLESKPYVEMTHRALGIFGVRTDNYALTGAFPFRSPGRVCVEGDWSNGAFFLAAASLGSPLTVSGLNADSAQGDRAISAILSNTKSNVTIDAADIPDLVPILSIVAAANNGAVFTNIQRLRIKESDRVASVIQMLQSLSIHAEASDSSLIVYPGQIQGGIVDSVNDHRIAMSAAIAATVAAGPVTIRNAQCVAKSYPAFWEDYRKLGGNYEQYIR